MKPRRYVRFGAAIDYQPYTTIRKGETGCVVGALDECLVVRLERPHAGLAAWGNTATLHPDDAEGLVPIIRPCSKRTLRVLALAVAAGLLCTLWLPTQSGVSTAQASRRGAELAFINNNARTLERVVYEDGHIYVRRIRYAQGSVVGLTISVREITPDEVPAEEEHIRKEE